MATEAASPQILSATVPPDETQPAAAQLISYTGLVELVRKWSKDPRVLTSIAGSSTCGRDIFLIAISRAENLSSWVSNRRTAYEAWDQLVKYTSLNNPQVGYPDLQTLRKLRPTLLLHAGSFGFEASHTEAACELIDHLLTSEEEEVRTILDESIVLIMPMVNPDSRELAIQQWKQYRHAPGWLGAGNSYGFLMNRDFYALSQPENRAVHNVMNEWRPLMVLDTHEDMAFLGARREEKCWLPPFREPRHKNLESKIIRIVDEFSAAIANRWRREGFNVWHEENGSFISFLVLDGRCDIHCDLHGIPCLFTESARTPGGQSWEDRNRQKVLAALTFFHKAAKEYPAILATQFDHWSEQIAKGIAQAPTAFVIPRSEDHTRDLDTTEKLVSILLSHEIQVYTVEKPFPAFVVPAGQPNRTLILAMLDVQPWNLMSLAPAMGVECLKLEALPTQQQERLRHAELQPVTETVRVRPARVEVVADTSPILVLRNTESSLPTINRALDLGIAVRWLLLDAEVDTQRFDAGTFFIEDIGTLHQLARERGLKHRGLLKMPASSRTQILSRPSIGVYLGQGADEKNLCASGEVIWTLDNLGFTWAALTEDEILAKGLRDFDVLIVPSGSAPEMLNGWDVSAQNYRKPWQVPGRPRGLGKMGIARIVDFIRQGGRYIGIGAGGALACQELGGIADVSIVEHGLGQARVYLDLKAPDNPVLFGYRGFRDHNGQWHTNELPAFYYCDLLWPRMDNYSGPLFRPGPRATTLATFKRVDHEEWTEHLERPPHSFAGHGAIVYQPIGKGSVLLLGVNVGFRGQWISLYGLLSNAILSWNISSRAGKPSPR